MASFRSLCACLLSSDHGKGMTGSVKKLLVGSSNMAIALYQAKNDDSRIKKPPAIMICAFGMSLESRIRYPMARRRTPRSTMKKRMKNAKLDFKVHIIMRVVKMNHP